MIVSVYAVFADAEEAKRIGRLMVEEKLAACVNVLGPCQSIYRWEGAIEEATECPALFKTTDAHADALIVRIAELHSYEVPAIMVWPIERIDDSYARWIEREIGTSVEQGNGQTH
ncbi:divalent-cation tolerance protein CutA [Sphingomonas xanthus]|uniref:Divalent-cation tolerance protein CutA n=1 Tax=Sphingomonas xanthus TaxID=2594473 RepID=A0A516ITW4_9SPHN|nr:divalent-cation tolerance protein CutA [Sphingomonas xanthus]QDP20356.1 divalent-cation tolerance protein CutA [Sphingomonas xanthus]